jgi:WD repeat and SOF domain-containing protein 1
MVKVKAICRNEKEYTKQTNTAIDKVQRNPTDASMHPFQKAREYKRAINAAKLEKVFAKPFLSALDQHSDGVSVMAKNKYNLTQMISGAADGEIIFWNLPDQKPLFQINAHHGFVRGLTFANNSAISADTIFVSSGDDRKVQLWSLNKLKSQYEQDFHQKEEFVGSLDQTRNYLPRATYISKHMVTGLDHSY